MWREKPEKMSQRLRQERFESLLKIAQVRKWNQQLRESETQRRLNIVAGAQYPRLGHFDREMLVLDVLEKLRVDAEAESQRASNEMVELMGREMNNDTSQPKA